MWYSSGMKSLKGKSKATPARNRVTALLSDEMIVEIKRAMARLAQDKVRVSLSSLIDVALKELLSRRDLSETLRRHGAAARRQSHE